VHRARNRYEGSCREIFPGGLALQLTNSLSASPLLFDVVSVCRIDSTQARALTQMGIIEKGDSEVQVRSSLKGGVGGLLQKGAARRNDGGEKRTRRLTAADGAKGGPCGS
jgi:hypothetical protein